jgi:hypothetical protein
MLPFKPQDTYTNCGPVRLVSRSRPHKLTPYVLVLERYALKSNLSKASSAFGSLSGVDAYDLGPKNEG